MDTADTFREKWHRNPDLAFRQTLDEGSDIHRWILNRNGWADVKALGDYLGARRRILDAGCGNGRVTALLAQSASQDAEVVGVDLTAADVARENVADLPNVAGVHEGDLTSDLSWLGTFDFIYCQEVLHHTTDPAGAFSNLARLLNPGGELAVYVYKLKAPIREYTDDYVRAAMSEMPYEDAMEVSRAIAEIGRVLSELDARVQIPAVEALGIEAGEYDVQRFIYQYFMKCFHSDELDAEANAVINFDWYHPQLATRHTREEVRTWFEAQGLEVVHDHVDPYGVTMRGRRA